MQHNDADNGTSPMGDTAPEAPGLSATLAAARARSGLPAAALTVLSGSKDPYRLDTPAPRRDAEWLAALVARFLPDGRAIHLRGLHYLAASAGDVTRPDGRRYVNDAEAWEWMCDAAKAARWLGLVHWSRIRDERNAAPVIFAQPGRYLDRHAAEYRADAAGGAWVESFALDLPRIAPPPLPDLRRLTPWPALWGTPGQRWRISVWGEKSSLADLLTGIAREVSGEVVLPTGDASDTLIADAMGRAAEDGRGLAVIYCADFDPSGFAMPRAVARKMQALRDQAPAFATVPVVVVRAAVTAAQADAWRLPSTPLKPEERRADGWRARWGREQSEIDSALALAPDRLADAIRAEVRRFHDSTLADRDHRAAWEWTTQAIAWRDALPGWSDHLRTLAEARTAASEAEEGFAAALETLRPAAAAINEARAALGVVQAAARDALGQAMRDALASGALSPPPDMPAPDLAERDPQPIYHSDEAWHAATLRMIADRDGSR